MQVDNIFHDENITANSEQIKILKKHFPSCFDKDGQFILDAFKTLIKSESVGFSDESYSLNWLGKSYAQLLRNEKPRTFICSNEQHNSKEENVHSQHLLIKGDNLEVLKHLNNAYSEKIKMIYIDPPYNTRSGDFIYKDDRKFSKEELVKLAHLNEEEAERILDFTSRGSNSHSAWLTFMYPRLYIAHKLLTDDGLIFISIDDNEQAQLKLLCDEVFGEENFVGNIGWESKTKAQNTKDAFNRLQPKIEHIFVYTKANARRFNLTTKGTKNYDFEDENGVYRWHEVETMSAEGVRGRETMVYEILGVMPPEGFQWKLGVETIQASIEKGEAKIEGNKPYIKMRPENERSEITEPFWAFFDKSIGTAETAKRELTNLIGNHGFETVKPVEMIKKLIFHSTNNDSIVLDFFAGSGTTAHAVAELNLEDGGNRKFIMVQLPEVIDKDNAKDRVAYEFCKKHKLEPTVFSITEKRVEVALKKLKSENPEYEGDLGFKIYETVPLPNNYAKEVEKLTLDNQGDLFDGFTVDEGLKKSILTTWTLYDRIPLTSKLVKMDFDGYIGFYSDGFNCLYLMNSNFGISNIESLLKKIDSDSDFIPNKIVIYGYAFSSKAQRELDEALRSYSNKKSIDINLNVRYY